MEVAIKFSHMQLNNGLTIIAEVSPSAASMALGFFTRTGSRDENNDVHGVSHFLEHMMFKGTSRRTAFDVNREFDDMGAAYNAFTSEENTVYYAAVLPEFQARAVDLLADILRPSLRHEDFDLEKNVILEEIALYEDRPDFRLYERLMAEYFSDHPLGRSVLGTPESIKGMRRDAMEAYFRRRYSPTNMIAVATGNVAWDALTEQLDRACGDWTPLDAVRELPPGPNKRIERFVADSKLSRQHIALISPAPSAQSADRYAAQLLACILGDHTGSRLYYALVEPAIAEDASVIYEPMDEVGGMLTFLTADPDQASEALQTTRDVFKQLVDDGLTALELIAAKNKIASGSVLKGELPMGRLTAVGFEWTYRKTYNGLAQQIEEMMAVTADQVLDVARECKLTEASLVTLGPRERV
ncbi:MAG: insulinase family protein [Planctomycetes bacterium]|nr:insulinase family protein [Planctomycetota bacterium]